MAKLTAEQRKGAEEKREYRAARAALEVDALRDWCTVDQGARAGAVRLAKLWLGRYTADTSAPYEVTAAQFSALVEWTDANLPKVGGYGEAPEEKGARARYFGKLRAARFRLFSAIRETADQHNLILPKSGARPLSDDPKASAKRAKRSAAKGTGAGKGKGKRTARRAADVYARAQAAVDSKGARVAIREAVDAGKVEWEFVAAIAMVAIDHEGKKRPTRDKRGAVVTK